MSDNSQSTGCFDIEAIAAAMPDTAISIENISKTYRLGLIGSGTLREDLQGWWHRVRGLPDPNLRVDQVHQAIEGHTLWALQEVTLAVKQGEVLGIIGRNGAGKSTLLKILSRVTAPTSGRLTRRIDWATGRRGRTNGAF